MLMMPSLFCGCGASQASAEVVSAGSLQSEGECTDVYMYSPSFRRETTISTGGRDGRSSHIDADHRGANALLLHLDLVDVFCCG